MIYSKLFSGSLLPTTLDIQNAPLCNFKKKISALYDTIFPYLTYSLGKWNISFPQMNPVISCLYNIV